MGKKGHAYLRLNDAQGKQMASLTAAANGDGGLWLTDNAGTKIDVGATAQNALSVAQWAQGSARSNGLDLDLLQNLWAVSGGGKPWV